MNGEWNNWCVTIACPTDKPPIAEREYGRDWLFGWTARHYLQCKPGCPSVHDDHKCDLCHENMRRWPGLRGRTPEQARKYYESLMTYIRQRIEDRLEWMATWRKVL